MIGLILNAQNAVYEEKNSGWVVLIVAAWLVLALGVTVVCWRMGYAGGRILWQPWSGVFQIGCYN